jgi:hypothetical protein
MNKRRRDPFIASGVGGYTHPVVVASWLMTCGKRHTSSGIIIGEGCQPTDCGLGYGATLLGS